MWTCSELKKNAWNNLSPNYWWALLLVFLDVAIVSTISSVISGISGAFSSVFSTILTSLTMTADSHSSFYEVMAAILPIIIGLSALLLFAILLSYAVAIFVSNPLSAGTVKWFIIQREQKTMHSIEALFSSFRKGVYKHIVSGMAWKLLWTALWGLVSVIPLLIPTALAVLFGMNADYAGQVSANFGISNNAALFIIVLVFILMFITAYGICIMINLNRYYSYLYVVYILIDEPDIGYREAIRKSRRMSRGQKGKMFILDLSFIGWWLLVFLTCGLLVIALYPYLFATYAELYFTRKEELASAAAPL